MMGLIFLMLLFTPLTYAENESSNHINTDIPSMVSNSPEDEDQESIEMMLSLILKIAMVLAPITMAGYLMYRVLLHAIHSPFHLPRLPRIRTNGHSQSRLSQQSTIHSQRRSSQQPTIAEAVNNIISSNKHNSEPSTQARSEIKDNPTQVKITSQIRIIRDKSDETPYDSKDVTFNKNTRVIRD
jgi:hypothetical protein